MKWGVSYKDKIQFKCDMCGESSWGAKDRYLWVGAITLKELHICTKCAQREVGRKKFKTIMEEK